MSDTEPFQRAHSAALRFLSHRQRSESEVRTRLQRSFPAPLVDQVIEALKERHVLDDSEFARQWTESRDSLKPRSARAVERELLAKGVEQGLASDAVRGLDDEENAYRAGLARSARMDVTDLNAFRGRLWGYLKRRGFSDSVSRKAIDRVWRERDDTP
jgi:regulatory protein